MNKAEVLITQSHTTTHISMQYHSASRRSNSQLAWIRLSGQTAVQTAVQTAKALAACASAAHARLRAANAQASRGERMRYQLAAAEQETIDETREHWEGKVTSSAEAWWRAYS